MTHSLRIVDAGTDVPYTDMLMRQRQTAQALINGKTDGTHQGEEVLYLLEHQPVYTLGRRGHADNMLLSPDVLKAQGIDYVHTDRGGDITYHGHGQLVAYPIIDLERHHLGVKEYVNMLEESVRWLLSLWGIRGEHVEGATGVWIEPCTPRERKICAIGIHCSHYVTTHGIGLNVNTDLGRFAAIHPCGFVDKGVTSMQTELGHAVNMAEVKRQYAFIFTALLKARQ